MKELQTEETTEETADLVRLEGKQSGTGILQHPALIPTQIFTPGSDANAVSVHPSWSKENQHKQIRGFVPCCCTRNLQVALSLLSFSAF